MNQNLKATFTTSDPYASNSAEIRSCLKYWDRLRGERFAPAWMEFDWSEIPPAIVPYFGVVDVQYEPLDFIYRFWGTAHADAHHQELTRKSVREMRPEAEGQSVFAQYEATLTARQPVLFNNTIQVGLRMIEVHEISLRLLFSDDGETVHQLMAFSDIRKDRNILEEAFTGKAGPSAGRQPGSRP